MAKRLFALIAVLAMFLMGTSVFAQAADSAVIRYVHALEDAPAVDIYVNGGLSYAGLEYGQATPYLPSAVGTQQLVVTVTGETDAVWEQVIDTAAASAYTLVVSSDNPLGFTAYSDDLNPLPIGRARLTAVHAAPEAPVVDIVLPDGREVIPNLEYNQPYGTLDIPAQNYEFVVIPDGGTVNDAIIPATAFPLATGTYYVAVAFGTSNAEAMLLSAPTLAGEGDFGYLRVVHAVPDAPAVDVYANNSLIIPALAFEQGTEYIAVPAGDYDISLTEAGTTDEVASASLTIEAGTVNLAIAALAGDEVEINAVTGAESLVSADQAAFTVVNLTGDAEVTSEVVEPSTDDLTASVNGDETALGLTGVYGGVYYDVIAIEDAVIALPPVSIPFTAEGVPVALASLPTPEPTPVPEVVVATADPNVVLPTPTPEPQVQAAVPTATGPTARIMLNPGANLHLRRYPSSEAESLGLAPSGTILIVNGREGAPEPPSFFTPTPTPEGAPEPTPYIDPVTLLAEDEDLDPAQTWLFVTYATPDGGTITAWVNALYVFITDARGRQVDLRELPTVPRNRSGEVNGQAAGVAPTQSPFRNVPVATIVGLLEGANLHLRRYANSQAESLALLPNGTQMIILGRSADDAWFQVEYQGTVGWVAAPYVRVTFNDREYDPLQIPIEATPTRTPTATPGA